MLQLKLQIPTFIQHQSTRHRDLSEKQNNQSRHRLTKQSSLHNIKIQSRSIHPSKSEFPSRTPVIFKDTKKPEDETTPAEKRNEQPKEVTKHRLDRKGRYKKDPSAVIKKKDEPPKMIPGQLRREESEPPESKAGQLRHGVREPPEAKAGYMASMEPLYTGDKVTKRKSATENESFISTSSS